ncbi:MAG: replication-relaxation family protein, partial [candidate division WOR-3 bacterium]|nr:replication-relaxation family protein [candidate division WOR-3 bacterium]
MRWQEYDWTALKILNDYRFLTTPILYQLVKLQHPNLPFETFRHRITILWRSGFLERPKEQISLMVRSDDFHIVMCLSRDGAEMLANHFGLDEEKLSWRADQEKVGFRLLEHQLSVARFRATIELSQAFKILFWLSDGQYYQTIHFRPTTEEQKKITEAEYIGAQVKETIRPDSFFGLVNKDGQTNFYALEIDRGTQVLKTMARKYLAYYKLIKNLERE